MTNGAVLRLSGGTSFRGDRALQRTFGDSPRGVSTGKIWNTVSAIKRPFLSFSGVAEQAANGHCRLGLLRRRRRGMTFSEIRIAAQLRRLPPISSLLGGVVNS
jgi:hypothetical protein